MGQQQSPPSSTPPSPFFSSSSTSSSSSFATRCTDSNSSNAPRQQQQQQRQIRQLITYARHHYEENPTESLSALLRALTLNSGEGAARQAYRRLSDELGPEIANHVEDHRRRTQRAVEMVEQLLRDESTILYQQGRQHLLQQTMEDGSSVVCSRCNDVVSSARWQQHQKYWCRCNNNTAGTNNDGDGDGGDDDSAGENHVMVDH